MFYKLKVRDSQIIVITDGGRGAYAYDGKMFYQCPIFEGPVVSTLGAGDAFASTFCAAPFMVLQLWWLSQNFQRQSLEMAVP